MNDQNKERQEEKEKWTVPVLRQMDIKETADSIEDELIKRGLIPGCS